MPTPIRHAPHRSAAGWTAAAILAAALAAALAAPSVASADSAPRPSSLSWVRLPGAEACIGSRALALRVEERLGREVFVPPSRASVVVEGRVEPSGAGGFRATVTVTDEHGAVQGAREIHTASARCSAMDDDLVLVIAVTIDPDAALGPARPAPARPPPRPPPAPPSRPAPDCPAPPPSPSPSPWRASLEAGGAAVIGLLPRAAGGILIRTHVTPPRFWSFDVGGVLFPAVGAQQGSASASFQLTEAFVNVCPLTVGASRVALSACAGVQVGALHAQGSGFPAASSPEEAIFNVAVEGRVRWRPWGPLLVGAGLGLAVPVLRTRFTYFSAGTSADLFTVAPIAGVLDLSAGVEFP